MKCINKLLTVAISLIITIVLLTGCAEEEPLALVSDYEVNLNKSLYTGELFASDLVVVSEDINIVDFSVNGDDSYASLLFGVDDEVAYYAEAANDKLYPASTTKILTAYIALKYGNLEDEVVVSENAINLPSDSSMAGIQPGETYTLYDLVNGLMLCSGNDCGVAIAEHLSGSVDAFAELMNEEANALGATNSHFVNPHGMPDDDHYTTAYDLYLIFNAAIQNEDFMDIISQTTYVSTYLDASNAENQHTWTTTVRYKKGTETSPSNVTVIGGKTGTTNAARSCLVLLEEDDVGNQYISIVMGASSANMLYDVMTPLIESLPVE